MDAQAGRNLLYVADHDEAVSNSLALLLESYGWQVQTFANGRECLKASVHRPPVAIVADLKMPLMGALELHEALLERRLSIPLVILTIYGEDRELRQRLPQGITEFLEKPCDGETLDAAIRRVVSRMGRLIGR